jgi:hypothetical protein
MLSVALNIVIASQVWARGIAKKDTSMPMGLAMGAYGGIQQWPGIV